MTESQQRRRSARCACAAQVARDGGLRLQPLQQRRGPRPVRTAGGRRDSATDAEPSSPGSGRSVTASTTVPGAPATRRSRNQAALGMLGVRSPKSRASIPKPPAATTASAAASSRKVRLSTARSPQRPRLRPVARKWRAHPEQPLQRHAPPLGRPRIEGPVEVHQRGRLAPAERRRQGRQQHAPCARGPALPHSSDHRPPRPAPAQLLIQRGDAGRQALALLACLELAGGHEMRRQPRNRHRRGHPAIDT